MAGVLPGVECARRRRSGWKPDTPAVALPGGSRRSSICLYPSKFESNLHSFFSLKSSGYEAYEDDKLGEVAREARERLDKRLRTQRNTDPQRQKKNVSGGTWWGVKVKHRVKEAGFGQKVDELKGLGGPRRVVHVPGLVQGRGDPGALALAGAGAGDDSQERGRCCILGK